MYGANVAVVEPHGLDAIDVSERHGSPRDLFGLWFGANAETANFAVGIIVVSLYGTSLVGAIIGLAIGGVLGYTCVSLVSLAGPRLGLPQMMISQRAFGQDGNVSCRRGRLGRWGTGDRRPRSGRDGGPGSPDRSPLRSRSWAT